MSASALIAFLSIMLFAGTAVGVDEPPAPPAEPKVTIETVRLAGQPFRLELAADPVSRERGMMGRRVIKPGTGMIFVFRDEQLRSFWMAHCVVDMDAYFLDATGRIVARHAMKKEPLRHRFESAANYHRRLKRYTSRRPAQFVIEVPAGSIKTLGLKVGDRIEFDRARLVAAAR
ncbi:MAG: DUF192 domain-containing protein [Phycisphaerales bacterium]|nr:DUF192 domain-containing protein [Phycisphaerae bacterium]NNF42425.1 DUF192 domain-containing protein [Phycisphaerales bacterium]NNM26931.1 DUF192 domain-containing protein [Phycisphaerales bacterium]